jgi:uncharacterized cupredoxin-like copper-binding protein
MIRRQARFMVIVGAVGLLTLGTLTGVAVTKGDFGSGQRLALANCGPSKAPGTVVQVTLSDRNGVMMGAGNSMMVSLNASPNSIGAGIVTFVATNVGALNHELLVLPAPTDGVGTRSIGNDAKIDETASLGEASTSCASGVGPGISPGTTSWVTLHLGPGNYELLCDIPWHYANGMFTALHVN